MHFASESGSCASYVCLSLISNCGRRSGCSCSLLFTVNVQRSAASCDDARSANAAGTRLERLSFPTEHHHGRPSSSPSIVSSILKALRFASTSKPKNQIIRVYSTKWLHRRSRRRRLRSPRGETYEVSLVAEGAVHRLHPRERHHRCVFFFLAPLTPNLMTILG